MDTLNREDYFTLGTKKVNSNSELKKILIWLFFLLLVLTVATVIYKIKDLKILVDNYTSIFNLLLTFFLLIATSFYCFLTYKYVLLSRSVLQETIENRFFDIKPSFHVRLEFFVNHEDFKNTKYFSENFELKNFEFEVKVQNRGKGIAYDPVINVSAVYEEDNNIFGTRMCMHQIDNFPSEFNPGDKFKKKNKNN